MDLTAAPDATPEPLISVITVVLDGVRHLESCILSVAEQSGARHEHLIVDGGSTDGTVQVIERYEQRLTWRVSEPDRGIGDAMNKASAHACGQWFLFLHSDDYLVSPKALAVANEQLDPCYDLVAFAVDYQTAVDLRRLRPRGFGPWFNFKTGLCHQGVLINRRLFERIGPYDPTYKIAVDYEFFLRAYRARAKLKLCPETLLAVMRDGGLSARTDWPNVSQRLAEERAIHMKHCPNAVLRALYRLYWALYLPFKRATSR